MESDGSHFKGDLVVVGLKALLEAAQGIKPQCFWPQLPGVPVLGVNGEEKERRRMVAISRHLPQLMAVLSDCCAVLGTWCHLCTGYFRKGGWMWTEMQTLSTALCFLECWAWALLSCVSPAHTQPVVILIHSLTHPALTYGLHAWPRLALSPRGRGGSASVPQATFLSQTNEGVRPWVVTDTGFQLLTKKHRLGLRTHGHLVAGIFPGSAVSRYEHHPRQAGVVSNFPIEVMG